MNKTSKYSFNAFFVVVCLFTSGSHNTQVTHLLRSLVGLNVCLPDVVKQLCCFHLQWGVLPILQTSLEIGEIFDDELLLLLFLGTESLSEAVTRGSCSQIYLGLNINTWHCYSNDITLSYYVKICTDITTDNVTGRWPSLYVRLCSSHSLISGLRTPFFFLPLFVFNHNDSNTYEVLFNWHLTQCISRGKAVIFKSPKMNYKSI